MKKLHLIAMAIILIIGLSTMNAQVKPTYELTSTAIEKIMQAALQYAEINHAPGGSIAIVDAGGHLLHFHRIDGTFPSSALVAIDKATTAALFKADTQKFEDNVNGGREALITVGYNFLKGGIPIIYKGVVIGAIGVSGAASADQDSEIAKAGSEANIL